MIVAEVLFDIPLDKGFDYAVPEALAGRIKAGHRVLAPLGGRRAEVGIVARLHGGGDLPPEKLKSLTALLDPAPALSPQDLALAGWIAKRWFCSRGEAAFCVCPVGSMRPLRREAAPRVLREPSAPYGAPRPAALTAGQRAALDRIRPALDGGFAAFLLQGANATGKTEVYLQLIEAALAAGKTAHLLVPEIGLTPQTEAHLLARFGAGVGVWHSALSRGERWRLWEAARAGQVRVAVGPRSALFLPLPRPGLIVLDEEHDPSYKSDAAPHYHAREAALEKGRLWGCPVVLGSATPAMETLSAARAGRITPVRLEGRVGGRPFPSVQVVDMRRERGWYMSDALVAGIKDRLARGEQTLLFLNRRGFATQVVCKGCGWAARCPQCQVSLVFHKYEAKAAAGAPRDLFEASKPAEADAALRCHTCEHRQAFPPRCPECAGDVVVPRGRGTQRVEADLKLLFPSARLLRWDRDTTQRKAGHDRAFQAVRSHAVDIVIGTQMVAQGLDFPRVTLGGILDADAALRFPDFRAGERAFRLLSQVAGRVGRGDAPGEVILQTRHPDHYAVAAARAFDYDAFAEKELAVRRESGYPPFTRLASLLVRAKTDAVAEAAAEGLVRDLEARLPPEAQVLGPAPAFHHHREGWSQWQVLLKAPPGDALDRAVPLAKAHALPAGASLSVDADPEDLA